MCAGVPSARSCGINLLNCDWHMRRVVVPDFRPMRKQVFEVSGQYYVPVLRDGDTILSETHEILAYLERHYAKPTE